jgi:hypothetical protein
MEKVLFDLLPWEWLAILGASNMVPIENKKLATILKIPTWFSTRMKLISSIGCYGMRDIVRMY